MNRWAPRAVPRRSSSVTFRHGARTVRDAARRPTDRRNVIPPIARAASSARARPTSSFVRPAPPCVASKWMRFPEAPFRNTVTGHPRARIPAARHPGYPADRAVSPPWWVGWQAKLTIAPSGSPAGVRAARTATSGSIGPSTQSESAASKRCCVPTLPSRSTTRRFQETSNSATLAMPTSAGRRAATARPTRSATRAIIDSV